MTLAKRTYQVTIGESFRRVLEKRGAELERERQRLAEEKKAKLREWSRKYEQIQKEHSRKSEEYASISTQTKDEERIMPFIEKYFVPVTEQAVREKWSPHKAKMRMMELTAKMAKEMPSEKGVTEAIRSMLIGTQSMKAGVHPYISEAIKKANLKDKSPLVALEFIKAAAERLKGDLEDLEKQQARMRTDYEGRIKEHDKRMAEMSLEAEQVREVLKYLGPLGRAEYVKRARKIRGDWLAEFAARHAGALPLVDAQIKMLGRELAKTAPAAEELEAHRAEAKKIEEKQLAPLLLLLQREGVLKKDERQYVTKESLKDALRSLRGKIQDKAIKQGYAFMPTVAKYAQHQQNIRRLERIMQETGAQERLGEIRTELGRLQRVRTLMLQAKR